MEKENECFTVCPRSSYPLCIVSYYVKWVTTAFRGALFFFNFCGEEA